VEARGLEPPNLLTASQALYQLSYAPERAVPYHPRFGAWTSRDPSGLLIGDP